MNFKFTKKRALIFIGGLLLGAVLATATEAPWLGTVTMIATIWYIVKET